MGINGFGRMGRMSLRAGLGAEGLEFVHVNEVAGGGATAAHRFTFDSVHGRWGQPVSAQNGALALDGKRIPFSEHKTPEEVPWKSLGVDLVLDCTVNGLFQKAAAEGPLRGTLGYEELPLVSVDFKGDKRSAIVDALSTMVVDGTSVKVLAWYDNEIGYVHCMIELAQKVAASLG